MANGKIRQKVKDFLRRLLKAKGKKTFEDIMKRNGLKYLLLIGAVLLQGCFVGIEVRKGQAPGFIVGANLGGGITK